MRIDVAEGEVFEFAAQLAHAEAVSERSVDVEGFLGDARLLFGLEVLERAHVVEPVGELDDDDADVVDHGEEHLADVLGLRVFAVGELDLVELGDAVDDVRDLLAEAFVDLVGGDVGVFDGVVKQAGGDRGGVHLELGEHLGYFEGMDDVGLAGGALLTLVLLLREDPGSANQVLVVAGAVRAQRGKHVLEPVFEVKWIVWVWRGCGCGGAVRGSLVSGDGRSAEGAGGLVERRCRVNWCGNRNLGKGGLETNA